MKDWLLKVSDNVRSKWQSFRHNFHWENYAYLFEGALPRLATAIPLAGYLVVFNDGIAQYLTFNSLAPNGSAAGLLSTSTRLRLIYFGLVSLGIAALLYKLRRPYVIRMGSTFEKYKAAMLNLAAPSMFIEANYSITRSGFDPWTRGGKYYDSEYEDFIELATGARPGQSIKEAYENRKAANWTEAITRYEPLITGMLQEVYFREGRKRRFSLTIAIALAVLGYELLAIPSLELFVRVLAVTFSGSSDAAA